MTAAAHFSHNYAEARAKFLAAAEARQATIHSFQCPATGPEGEQIYCDTAWFGPLEAERVLVTISATHGAEGFCGSGVQVGWLEEGLIDEMPEGLALLQIHAINPYGFSWLRRVTEDNVDMNRNFVDFDAPLPENPGYSELAEALGPPRWDEATIAETAAVLAAYGEAHGARGLQKAISGGQYSHPDGIFYGGRRPTWSHRVLKMIFSVDLAKAKKVAVIDYHTGLGPRGHGERICVHAPGSVALDRANRWYGGDLTSPALGNSASVELSGYNVLGMEAAAPDAEMTVVALEYGTQPTPLVRLALRADNWLHRHGDLKSEQGRAIKQQIREAFYQDAADWKDMVWERGVETQRLAIAGLSED